MLKRSWSVVAGCATVAALALGIGEYGGPAGVDSSQGEPRQAERPQARNVLHVDPATGEFLARPVDGVALALPEELTENARTSAEGLQVVDSPVQDGGIMVRLEGRFQSLMSAESDAEGLRTACAALGQHGHSHAAIEKGAAQ